MLACKASASLSGHAPITYLFILFENHYVEGGTNRSGVGESRTLALQFYRLRDQNPGRYAIDVFNCSTLT